MEFTDGHQPKTADQAMKVSRAYVAPSLKRLSPAAAKDLLLGNSVAHDPKVQQVLDCVDELQGEKGS